MGRYLISGKDSRGRTITEAVRASSADEAVQRFKERGHEEVTLHSDDVVGHMFRADALKHMSPRDLVAIGRISRPKMLGWMILRLYRNQWWMFLIGVAFIVGRRILEVEWDLFDTFAVAYLGLPVVLVVLGELFSPGRKFDRIMTLNAWGRWAEMLAALPAVKWVLPAPQYAFLEAKALSGLGRIEEALEIVRPFADDPKTPAWLYWGQLADVFSAAKLGDRVVECGEKAFENAPQNVTVLIDYAMGLLRYQRDTARAKTLLVEARRHEISDLIHPFLIMSEGVLAFEEKRFEPSRKLLEQSLKEVEKFRHSTPLMGAAIDRIHTYLALACAGTGDSLAAEHHYRLAEPRLKAFGATDLIERCQAVIGRI